VFCPGNLPENSHRNRGTASHPYPAHNRRKNQSLKIYWNLRIACRARCAERAASAKYMHIVILTEDLLPRKEGLNTGARLLDDHLLEESINL
jgi:hypothetical protein